MTSKVFILCGLVALVSAGTLRPGDRKQWKAAQESHGSFEIRPETWSKSAQNNEKEIDEKTTTIKSAQLATRTYFGYGDSKPIHEESMEIPKEHMMRHTQIYESQPTVQWYHRQPTFSWEYKNSDINNEGSISYKTVTVAESEQQQEDEQQSKQENMNMEERKAESAAEAAALQRAQYESNERAFHHHHQSRYENNYRQEKQREVIDQAQYVIEQARTTDGIQNTKKSDAEEIHQVEAEKSAEFKTETKPIVVLEQQTYPIVKSYTQYAKYDQPQEEKWAPVNYEFRYEVNDKETGDIKHHEEKAIEGKISGEYGLLDADGMTRIVKYTADDEHGFLADVTREERTGKTIVAAYEPKW